MTLNQLRTYFIFRDLPCKVFLEDSVQATSCLEGYPTTRISIGVEKTDPTQTGSGQKANIANYKLTF